jgi:hypothetical protein
MSTDRRLLTSQKNQLIPIITSAGLELTEFEFLTVRTDEDVSEVRHIPTGFYFRFEYNSKDFSFHGDEVRFAAVYSPGQNERTTTSRHLSGFPDQLKCFRFWIRALLQEVSAVDMWAEIAKQHQLMAMPQFDERPFSESEQEYIADQLQNIFNRYIPNNREPDKLEYIAESVRYLVDESKQVSNRRRYVLIVFGFFLTQIAGGFFPPEKAAQLIRDLIAALVPLIKTAAQLPL